MGAEGSRENSLQLSYLIQFAIISWQLQTTTTTTTTTTAKTIQPSGYNIAHFALASVLDKSFAIKIVIALPNAYNSERAAKFKQLMQLMQTSSRPGTLCLYHFPSPFSLIIISLELIFMLMLMLTIIVIATCAYIQIKFTTFS